MFTTVSSRQSGGRRWRHRLITLVTLPALVSALAVAVTAGPASAAFGPTVPCPTQPYDVIFSAGRFATYAKPIVVASSLTFNKSDGRIVQNDLDIPVVATFSSSVSKTYTVAQTSLIEISAATLIGTFKTSISTTITDSKTTQIGVNAQVTVPPHSVMIGDYGIAAYDVIYDAQVISKVADGSCQLRNDSTERGVSINVPTVDEGWRFRLA